MAKPEKKSPSKRERRIAKIHEVFQAFLEQELGNKVSQFNMQGLASTIIQSIDSVDKPPAEG